MSSRYIFMCLIILSYSIWLLLILVNGKTRSNKTSPWGISANSSCLRIDATHFSSENVICVNRLISANHSLDCYDDEELIAYHLLPKNRESSKVKKGETCRRRRCLHAFSRSKWLNFVNGVESVILCSDRVNGVNLWSIFFFSSLVVHCCRSVFPCLSFS
jgi:hypothetical protein